MDISACWKEEDYRNWLALHAPRALKETGDYFTGSADDQLGRAWGPIEQEASIMQRMTARGGKKYPGSHNKKKPNNNKRQKLEVGICIMIDAQFWEFWHDYE